MTADRAAAVREIAHRAVVLRDSYKVGDVPMAETSDTELVRLVSGHRLDAERLERLGGRAEHAETAAAGEPRLMTEGLSGGGCAAST
jgi:ABC-type sugar transport system ATPase subunit